MRWLLSLTAAMADSDNESDFASAESDHEVDSISLKLYISLLLFLYYG